MARRTFAVRASHRLTCRPLLIAVAVGIVVSSVSTSLWAQLPSTQFSTIFPPGGKFGTTVDVQVAGADQIDLSQLSMDCRFEPLCLRHVLQHDGK
jgi:hypothetical protein